MERRALATEVLLCIMVFAAGALSVFVLCESRPRPFLPGWLSTPLEVAGAVRTLTYHRSQVMQFEDWIGMPILKFGTALPGLVAVGLLGWASPGSLKVCLPGLLSKAHTQQHHAFQNFRASNPLMEPDIWHGQLASNVHMETLSDGQ